jgi:hypothetical protein
MANSKGRTRKFQRSRKKIPIDTPFQTDMQTEQGRLTAVLETYEDLRSFYQSEVRWDSSLYNILTVLTLVGTALTPLLVLQDNWAHSKFWLAVPSAVAGLAVAVNSGFHYRESWAQNYYTLTALINEQQKFLARASPDYSPDKTLSEVIDNFQNRMSTLVMSEVESWRQSMLQSDSESAKGQQDSGIQSLAITPDKPTFKPGESGTLSITLSGPAPENGMVIDLASDAGVILAAKTANVAENSTEAKVLFKVGDSTQYGVRLAITATKPDRSRANTSITVVK